MQSCSLVPKRYCRPRPSTRCWECIKSRIERMGRRLLSILYLQIFELRTWRIGWTFYSRETFRLINCQRIRDTSSQTLVTRVVGS